MSGVIIASAGLGICLVLSLAGCTVVADHGKRAGYGVCVAVSAGMLGFFIGMAWAGRP